MRIRENGRGAAYSGPCKMAASSTSETVEDPTVPGLLAVASRAGILTLYCIGASYCRRKYRPTVNRPQRHARNDAAQELESTYGQDSRWIGEKA